MYATEAKDGKSFTLNWSNGVTDKIVFGRKFLTHKYCVFDMENNKISIGNAKNLYPYTAPPAN
jgi:hypothetical protein